MSKPNKQNKQNNNNNAPKAPIETQAEVSAPTETTGEGATLAPVEASELFGDVRPFALIAGDVTFNEHDGASIASHVTVTELGHFIAKTMEGQASMSTRLANCLRHSRKMQPLKIDKRDKWGGATGEKETVSAFDYLKERLRANSATEGQFQNMFQLVEALDFRADNGLEEKANVFLIKNVMGKLREFGLIPPADKKAEWKEGRLKVTLPEGVDITAKAIMLSLGNGDSQAKMKKAIAEAEAEKARLAKEASDAKTAEVQKMLADAKAKAANGSATPEGEKSPEGTEKAPEGETEAETETETPEGATEATPPPAKAPEGAKEVETLNHYNPEYVSRGITSILGMWDKAVQAGATREQMREACRVEFAKLAVLMNAE